MNNPKILDNSHSQFQLKTYLSDFLTSTKYTELSIATGYWDLLGIDCFQLLENIPTVILTYFFCDLTLEEIAIVEGKK